MFNLTLPLLIKENRQILAERFWTEFYKVKGESYDVMMYKLGFRKEKPFSMMTSEEIADSFELRIFD